MEARAALHLQQVSNVTAQRDVALDVTAPARCSAGCRGSASCHRRERCSSGEIYARHSCRQLWPRRCERSMHVNPAAAVAYCRRSEPLKRLHSQPLKPRKLSHSCELGSAGRARMRCSKAQGMQPAKNPPAAAHAASASAASPGPYHTARCRSPCTRSCPIGSEPKCNQRHLTATV